MFFEAGFWMQPNPDYVDIADSLLMKDTANILIPVNEKSNKE